MPPYREVAETISSPARARVRMARVSAAWPDANAEPRHAAFEGGDALLEDVGGGVHDARVDVAELLQGEQPGGVVGVVEDVGGRLVNRHRARRRGRVAFLAAVDGQGGEVLLARWRVRCCRP